MAGGRGYDIFPRTFKARVLLALAFVGGALAISTYLAVVLGAFDFGTFDLFDETQVTVENRTDRMLTIYVAGQSKAVVPAGDTTTFSTQKIVWKFNKAKVQAVDFNGTIVFEEEIDLSELERRGYHIVIEAEAGDTAPQDTATPAEAVDHYPLCSRFRQRACLEAQTELVPLASGSCDGLERRICFVPLGTVDPDIVLQLVEYYKAEYGLAIGILTPGAIPEDAIDPGRNQVDGPSLGEYMERLFPADASDPNAVLIGLTPMDIYDRTSHYRFLFGSKATFEHPRGVVSTYRMQLAAAPPDGDEVLAWTRKMVTRYIGLLYYGLEETDDPRSLLYNHILSLRDLDRMGDRLPLE
jgi:predicted Zn-dependent protease